MKYSQTSCLVGLLALPLFISACGGSSSNNLSVEDDNAQSETPKQAIQEHSTPNEQYTDHTDHNQSDIQTNQNHAKPLSTDSLVDNKTQTVGSHDGEVNSKVDIVDPPSTPPPPIELDPLEKTIVTAALRDQVKEAKTARDNAGLPADYTAVYTIESNDGKTQELKLGAPDDSGENYFFNSTIFPQGQAQGKVKTALGGQPHTEETFKSYQQFYTGIEGTQKHVVYFGDTPVERDEPFFVELPTGLLTEESGIPADKEATYSGKAISAVGFGDFTYTVDFANKIGKGGSIKWQQPGGVGDIELAGGKIGKQILSVYEHPEMLPDTHSHKGQGISGKATISGSHSEYEYTALFFGPKAEEISGFISEKHADNNSSNQLVGDHDDSQNIASFAGER